VTVEQDGDAPPHQLGQGPVEQQPDPDGVAAVGADVELDHPVGPAGDRRAVRGGLHGQVPARPPGVGPGERRPARADAHPHRGRVPDPQRGPDHRGQLRDGDGGLGHGQEGRLVLEPGQLPDELVGRPRGQREGRLAAEGVPVTGLVGDMEQQVAADVGAGELVAGFDRVGAHGPFPDGQAEERALAVHGPGQRPRLGAAGAQVGVDGGLLSHPSAAYTSRHGVLTASEVISSGVSPVLAQR
jgi:hypothetical protein